MLPIEFFVAGKPEPKGSMSAFVIPGTKRAIVTDGNKKLKPWAKAIKLHASQQMIGVDPLGCAVLVELRFALARPVSVSRDLHTVRPDIDKLARGVLDALTGTIYRDDAQIVALRVSKGYDARPGVNIYVFPYVFPVNPDPQQKELL